MSEGLCGGDCGGSFDGDRCCPTFAANGFGIIGFESNMVDTKGFGAKGFDAKGFDTVVRVDAEGFDRKGFRKGFNIWVDVGLPAVAAGTVVPFPDG